jgi:hypothetical protein
MSHRLSTSDLGGGGWSTGICIHKTVTINNNFHYLLRPFKKTPDERILSEVLIKEERKATHRVGRSYSSVFCMTLDDLLIVKYIYQIKY